MLLSQYPALRTLYKYGINFRMFFCSTAATMVEWRRFRLRFFPLLDSRWPLNPLARFILPLAVTLNLFIAPLLLLIFGTSISSMYSVTVFAISGFEFRVLHEPEILNLEPYLGVSSMAMLLPSNLGSMSSLAMSCT